MQIIKSKQREKIRKEIKDSIPAWLYKWKSAGLFGKDITKYTDTVISDIDKILDKN